MNMEQLLDLELTGKIALLGESLPQCHLVHHKSHMTWDRTRAARVGTLVITQDRRIHI
jgi:hypothetical protein